MKNYLKLFMVFVAFLGCHTDSAAQCSDNCSNCKKSKGKSTSTMETGNKVTLSCKLTSPELRKRKDEVIARLKKQVLDRQELANGIRFRFNGSDGVLDEITSFIKSERQCCDFFNFNVAVNSDSSIWLEISGPEGAKEFITTELEM